MTNSGAGRWVLDAKIHPRPKGRGFLLGFFDKTDPAISGEPANDPDFDHQASALSMGELEHYLRWL